MRITSITFSHGIHTFHVHGDNAGAEGVWLGKGQVNGIYDAPVKSTWKTGAFQDGSTQRAYKKLHRDMQLGFHVKETTSSYEWNESEFRQLFDYELDQWDIAATPTVLAVTTTLSGTRSLEVLMHEQPEFQADIDPIQDEYGNLILKLRAGQPMWFEADVVTSFQGANATGSGTVVVTNPTDQIMRHEWVLTEGTWTVPDFSWTGAKGFRAPGGPFSTRTIPVTVTQADGIARISLDQQKLMIRDSVDNNILARLGGRSFAFAIPPYTPATSLPVSYTGAPLGGARIELHQPRRWSRPWGLERTAGS